MARILYGLSGQGSGHSSRAKVVIPFLQKQGHDVTVVSYDRGVQNLRPKIPVEEIFGLRFSLEKNEIGYAKTLLTNFLAVPEAIESLQKIRQIIEEKSIELVITDFEPLSAYIGNLKKIPVFSLDNQHRLTKAEVSYPKKYEAEALAAKMVVKALIPKAAAYLVTTFFPIRSKEKNVHFFPPIIRPGILDARPTAGERVLVYMSSPYMELVPLLKKIPQEFVCYGFEKTGRAGNVTFRKPSEKQFIRDLAGAKAVIGNAGFTLMSEALHLHKPYLALPVKSQFEQVLNAFYLQKLGYGRYYDALDQEKIEAFLFALPVFEKNLQKYKAVDNTKILKHLERLIRIHTT